MRLLAPAQAPALDLIDIQGQPIMIGHRSRLTLLSFSRDAACPFCTFRIYELTNRHAELSVPGLEIVAVFSASQGEVLRFARHRPRPSCSPQTPPRPRTGSTASSARCGAS